MGTYAEQRSVSAVSVVVVECDKGIRLGSMTVSNEDKDDQSSLKSAIPRALKGQQQW
jgi:hypothetical protein